MLQPPHAVIPLLPIRGGTSTASAGGLAPHRPLAELLAAASPGALPDLHGALGRALRASSVAITWVWVQIQPPGHGTPKF